MTDVVLFEVADHVATITINRPEAYNSLNYKAYELLSQFFSEADADPEVRAIIWTATGNRGFCTGDDVKELLGAGSAELARRISAGELEIPSLPMSRSETPIIAAVNGAAVGYGMELSLWPTSALLGHLPDSPRCSSKERSWRGPTVSSSSLA